MTERPSQNCPSPLVQLSLPDAAANPGLTRHAVARALACDRFIHCGQRLHCAWMAAELADRLRLIFR